jgi:sigma-B regulation protein RsbU (phosphoserine phosphatase)
MTVQRRNTPVSFLIRRSVRYLLVSRGFYLIQALVVLAALSFVLTGSRITAIDRYGNRADIVVSIFVTIATMLLLTAINRRVMTAIDRRFFREAYNAQRILTELGEAIPALLKTKHVLELVANKIADALHPENVTILLEQDDTNTYVVAYSSDEARASAESFSQPRSIALRDDGNLISRLRESNRWNAVDLSEDDLLSPDPDLAGLGGLSVNESQTLHAARVSLLIPIAANGRLHGLISLGRRLSDLPYATEDKGLLLVVAHQIATFIQNMNLISRLAEEERVARELEMAAEVQRHLFPADELNDVALEIVGVCLPALGVGGDYYDYFPIDDRCTGIAIADVAGKGIAAALLMSTVQASLRCQLTSGDKSLAEVVSAMNSLLQRSTSDGDYATFFLAQFDRATRNLTYVNAGHNPPMLIRGSLDSQRTAGELLQATGIDRSLLIRSMETNHRFAAAVAEEPGIRLLTRGGPIIGTFLDGPYEQETIQMQSGDVLVIYTDGVTEAENPTGAEFGEERLRSVLIESLRLSPRELTARVIESVLEWQGPAPQHDDITLIVVKVK